MAWSKREDETLREMWMSPQRYSAAQIAATMAGRSRNAVIGRINRRIRAGETELRRMDPHARTRPLRPNNGRPCKPADPNPQPKRRPDRPPLDQEKIEKALNQAAQYDATSLRQPLTELKPRQCRYPVNDPDPDAKPGMRGDFLFCGHKAQPGSSYCEQHHLRCYGRRKYDVEAEFASETQTGRPPERPTERGKRDAVSAQSPACTAAGKREAVSAELPVCAPRNPTTHLTEKLR